MSNFALGSVSDNIPKTVVGRFGSLELRSQQKEISQNRCRVPEGRTRQLRPARVPEERQEGLDEPRVGEV